jgi:hypothetical protein
MRARFQTFISILVAVIALRLMAAPTYLAWAMTAPWPFSKMAVPFTRLMRPARGNHQHHQLNGKGVNKTMKLDLTQRELPSTGLQPGVFADAVQGVKTDKRRKGFRTLTLIAELAALKSNNRRFTAAATYNLDSNRGVKRLIEDLKSWRGSDALPDLSQFDPEAEFVGKPFVCDPTFADEKGRKVILLSGFRPDPEKRLTVSPGFVRAKDQQQPATAAHTSPQGEAQQPASAPTAA